jgi:hypothetical protein
MNIEDMNDSEFSQYVIENGPFQAFVDHPNIDQSKYNLRISKYSKSVAIEGMEPEPDRAKHYTVLIGNLYKLEKKAQPKTPPKELIKIKVPHPKTGEISVYSLSELEALFEGKPEKPLQESTKPVEKTSKNVQFDKSTEKQAEKTTTKADKTPDQVEKLTEKPTEKEPDPKPKAGKRLPFDLSAKDTPSSKTAKADTPTRAHKVLTQKSPLDDTDESEERPKKILKTIEDDFKERLASAGLSIMKELAGTWNVKPENSLKFYAKVAEISKEFQ